MSPAERQRGLLDTNAVILLPRLTDLRMSGACGASGGGFRLDPVRRGRGESIRPGGSITSSRRPQAAYDAMIAAVAVVHDLPLFSCNVEDFAGIGDLHIVAVPHPGQVPEQRTCYGLC